MLWLIPYWFDAADTIIHASFALTTRKLVQFLVNQRNVMGWGSEEVGMDAGQAFAFEQAYFRYNSK